MEQKYHNIYVLILYVSILVSVKITDILRKIYQDYHLLQIRIPFQFETEASIKIITTGISMAWVILYDQDPD